MRYLAEALDYLGHRATPELRKHAAPLHWDHVSLIGDDVWNGGDDVWNGRTQSAARQLRPLRRRPSLLAA
jgi:hypothetical protein